MVLVTGLPAAGKSTVSTALAERLTARLISLDEIKERRYAEDPSIGNTVALRLAAETELWERLARADEPAVVDLWVAPGRDDERIVAALRRLGLVDRTVEVLCRVPAEVAVRRYVDRVRGGPHQPADAVTLERIRTAAEALAPLGLGTTLELDTTGPVDLGPVVSAIRALADRGTP